MILAVPAFVAPALGWRPAAESASDETSAGFFGYHTPVAADVTAGSMVQSLHAEPGMDLALHDRAAPKRLLLERTDADYLDFAADSEPVPELDKNDERGYVIRVRGMDAVGEPTHDGEEPATPAAPIPLHALLVLEAQRTIVAIGLSVHPAISSAAARLDASPLPTLSATERVAFTATPDGVPGWLLQVTWILLLVAIGLAARPLWAAGVVALFSRFNQGDILNNERRSGLVAAIRADPGVTFGELCQRAQLAAGVAQHHLRLLEQHELVRRSRDGRATRFYPYGPRFGPAALRSPVRQRLVHLVRQDPMIATNRLAHELGQRPQSTWHHLQVLRDAGILAPIRQGRLVRWNVVVP